MTSSSPLGTAVITGASSGIGAVYADRLARRGHDLLLVARDKSRLAALADKLGSATGRSVRTLAADLTQPSGLLPVEDVLRNDPTVTLLVNNAGVGSAAPLLEADIERMASLISLNVLALTRLTYAAAPAFARRGAGTIINIASIVAIAPEILNGVYGGSKAYVLALTRSLQHELGSKGLRFQAVLPGATATDFWDAAGLPVSNLPPEIVMPVADMVDAALAGLDAGELVTIPSLPDAEDWSRFEAARAALLPNLSRSKPAARFFARP